jgi:hypothetical protein
MRAREKLERGEVVVKEYASGMLEIWSYSQSASAAGVGQAG